MLKIRILVLMALAVLAATSCHNAGNKAYVQHRAAERWDSVGFRVIGSHGYEFGSGLIGTPYGGARVWYELRKIPDNGITYSGYLQRWGDEVHVYGPNAREALKP